MKTTTYFHRSYRTAGKAGVFHTSLLFIMVLALDGAILSYHHDLLFKFSTMVQDLLLACGISAVVRDWNFLPQVIKSLPVIDAVCVFPTKLVSLINFAASVLIISLVPGTKLLPRSFVIYLVFLSVLTAFSALFFTFVPHLFPYDIVDFSILYIGSQLGTWLLMPIVLAFVLTPLPAPSIEKFAVIIATLVYSILFGAVRYSALMLILNKLSVLHMAALYFTLGPLVDFIYVVAIYSLYINKIAHRLENNPQRWRWLF
jgi:hypothetical protein